MVLTMDDGCRLSSSDDNQFVDDEIDSFLPNLESSDLQHLQLKDDRMAWKSTLDSLKSFVMCDLQQQEKWTSPGGNMKQFKSNNKNLIINWYSKKQHTLCFQGRDGPTLKERLVQLVQNMPEMTANMPELNTPTTAVQTESQTMSPSTLSEDSYASGIQQTSVDREGKESSTKERSYSMVSADIEGLKLDLLILQKKVEENANLLSANIQKQEELKVATEGIDYKTRCEHLLSTVRKKEKEIEELEEKCLSFENRALSLEQENDSLRLALKIIVHEKNECDRGNKHSAQETNKDDLHTGLHTDDRPSWEANGATLTTNNRFSFLSNCETTDVENVSTDATALTSNNRLPVSRCETARKENEAATSQPRRVAKSRAQPDSVLIIGDSLIKNIDSQKLTKKTVDKRMYPGKTSDQICQEVHSIHMDVEPSHVIVHSGTNNLPSDSVESCVSKTENLALRIRDKFQTSKIGISSLTHREDISVSTKLSEVNEKLKEMSNRNGFHFIDNSRIDGSCLNGSKLHLNSKGSAYLATSFIKFLRPSTNKARRPQGFHAPLRQLGQLIMQLASGPIRAPVHKKPRL